MKSIAFSLAVVFSPLAAFASLQPGDSLLPYDIKNTRTGDEYCQVCVYGAKSGKIVAFGKLDDAGFWADLKKLQTWSSAYSGLGVFAQVIDSQDVDAIKAKAVAEGIKFPVVVAVEKDWDEIYQVKGVSRTIYYAKKNNKITWSGVGLNADAEKVLSEKIAADVAG